MLSEYFRDSGNAGLVAQTKLMPESARLPKLDPIFEFFGFNFGERVDLLGFLPVAILLGVAYHVLLNRSLFGYELKLSGANADAAKSAGVNPKKMVLITLFMSGAVAGMIGLPFLLADPNFLKYGDAFPTSRSASPASASRCWAATAPSASQPPRSCGRRSRSQPAASAHWASRPRSARSCRGRSCSLR